MRSIQLTVENEVGLHARPATLFVKEAQKYQAEITASYGGNTVNAKSLLALLTLGASKGAVVTVTASGVDEQAAVDALAALVNANFGE
jgi:phosphocarrier protein